jgi:hypothetical protein
MCLCVSLTSKPTKASGGDEARTISVALSARGTQAGRSNFVPISWNHRAFHSSCRPIDQAFPVFVAASGTTTLGIGQSTFSPRQVSPSAMIHLCILNTENRAQVCTCRMGASDTFMQQASTYETYESYCSIIRMSTAVEGQQIAMN